MAENRTAVFQWDPASGLARWIAGRRLQEGSLEALAGCGADTFVWLVDARGLVLTEVELPAASPRAQRQALPFVLEEQLLSPVEALAFATYRLSPVRLACAAFDGAALERTLSMLEEAGISVTHAVPDALCAPLEDGAWTLFVDDASALLRTARHAGCSFPLAQWRAFVGQAVQGLPAGQRQRLRIIGGSEALAAELAAEHPTLVATNEPERRSRLRVLADGFAGGLVMDLLDALPARRRREAGGARRWWLASAAMLAAVAVGHGALLASHVRTLEDRFAAARAASTATFRELFPGITRVEDARVQAMQALAEIDAARVAGTPFLDALAEAAAALPADAGSRFERIAYGNGALELRVRARDMQALEQYQQALSTASLAVQLVSVESREGGAVGLLRIGGGE